jgi:hypothetical protein
MMGVIPVRRLVEMFDFPDMRSLLDAEREEAIRLIAEQERTASGERDGLTS